MSSDDDTSVDNDNDNVDEVLWNPSLWFSSRLDLDEMGENNENREVVYAINEEALSHLPPHLQLAFRRVHQERIERLQRTHPDFEMRPHDYNGTGQENVSRASTNMERQYAHLESRYYGSNNRHDAREETLYLGRRGPLRVMNPDPPSSDEEKDAPQKTPASTKARSDSNSSTSDKNYTKADSEERPSDPIILRTLEMLTISRSTDSMNDAKDAAVRPSEGKATESLTESRAEPKSQESDSKVDAPKPRRLALD